MGSGTGGGGERSAPEGDQFAGVSGATAAATTIPRLLAAAAERVPEAPALLAPGSAPLTFRQLRVQVDATARTLNALGLGRGDRVAVALPDGPEMAVAFLAAATAATAAPLNTAATIGECARLMSELPARAVIVPAGDGVSARTAAAERGIPVVEVVVAAAAPAGCFALRGSCVSEAAGVAEPTPDDVALVLPTSGTTGEPRRVPLTHGNVCASALANRDALALTPADRCLNVTPMRHVSHLGIIVASLAAGSSLVCVPGFDATRFFAWWDAFRPTWYMAVPAMHRAILERTPAAAATIARCRPRFIRSGAAPLPVEMLTELEAVFAAPVIEGYGLTETAPIVTSNPLPPRPRKAGSVGLATGCAVAIVSEDGVPLPAGQRGEIVVRGPNVMPGYEDDPAANAAAFTADGWLRTGDEGHLDEDGYLFLSGRLKEAINRGGEKVAPGEVEAVLLTHPAVAQAVAFAVRDERLGEEVAAAVVPRAGHAVTETELRGWVAVRLAPSKVPRRVVCLDELPTGLTGKVRRIGLARALGLAPSARAAVPAEEPVLPRSEAEGLVAGIWAEVLGRERVGVDEDFLALGGDSIGAARVVARLRRALGLELSVGAFFDAPTVAAMARVIEEMVVRGVELGADGMEDGRAVAGGGGERRW